MSEQEKAILQLCVAARAYCNTLREDYDILEESYAFECLEHCIERLYMRVNSEEQEDDEEVPILSDDV